MKTHQRASKQLYHTLSETVDIMTAALSSSPECSGALNEDPCSISCHQERQPEQELTCAIKGALLPRLRNYNDLLALELGSVSSGTPEDLKVSSAADRAQLRYHSVCVIVYCLDQSNSNRDVHLRWG